MVVGSFDSALTHDALKSLALTAATADIMGESPAEHELARRLDDEEYVSRRRRVFPQDLTGGPEVIAFDLLVTGAHVVGVLKPARVICLADPDPGGLIAALPPDLVDICGLDDPEARGHAKRDAHWNPFQTPPPTRREPGNEP